ncbi:hypothetical protein [Nostoc sp. ChiQUE01b]|uniref:hypothetical protein n=1 Tax=Nostoc sp. ChiQUE01b TaxID=3075376 RepID=UPI002AD2F05B|nr:hypothetical protein [Nostoc sp. ChiQUE01b]MDZ8260591.1 hypothetical protein [Nostoc sp. ChiQUE01b]
MTLTHKPFSVQIFLIDANPDGMLTAEIPFQWTGHVLSFPRKDIKRVLEREEAQQPGIYLLVGEREEQKTLYVGKGGELLEHIKEQEQQEWWSTGVLLINQEYPLSMLYLSYLQDQLRKKAENGNKVILANPLDVEPLRLDESATVAMEGFLDKFIFVLLVLNFKFF